MSKKLYQKETGKAMRNFAFTNSVVHYELIEAIVEIKKSAAVANKKAGLLEASKSKAIIRAANTILKGGYKDQFPTSSLQGGAGTSINMNVNEVVATLASKYAKTHIHPLDDVNMSQSTNDVNPSALRMVCIRLAKNLLTQLDNLTQQLDNLSVRYKNTPRLGRTHLQDAVPSTFGKLFSAYSDNIKRDKKRISQAVNFLYQLNLGGTAIGTSINANKLYIAHLYEELRKISGIPIKKTKNLISLTNSSTDFCNLSAAINTLFVDLSKMATDIRILSSGPRGGISEIELKPLQEGSSIMPGKVNPVIPESINQVYYFVSGMNLEIHQASEAANLELSTMFPVIADSIISMLKVSTDAVTIFTSKCIKNLKIKEKVAQKHLESSTAYAALFVPYFGYDKVSKIVKDVLASKKSFKEVVLKNKLITEKKFQRIIKKYNDN